MQTKIRRRAETIGLALMASLGIIVLVGDSLGWLDWLAPGGTIPKITLLILSTVTLFLLLEVERFQILDDHSTILTGIDRRLSELDINAIARELKHNHYAGVIAVHKYFPDDVFIRYVQSAKEVTILNTWIPNLSRFIEVLENALNRGATVRILLLFPNSGVAQLRDEALRASPNPLLEQNVKQGVENCLDVLRYILERVGEDKEHHLKVKLYNSLPSISVYKADEHFFVSVFFHGQLAIASPQFEIEDADSILGQHVMRELNTLWTIGHEIEDIRDWRNQLDLIAGKF